MTPSQIPLDLPHRIAFDREDFLVAEANRAAVALVDQWPDWPTPSAMLLGPAGAGKSHLGAVWKAASNAVSLSARDLDEARVPSLCAARAVLLEDVDQLPSDRETALFHLLNLTKEEEGSLLMTSKVSPANLAIKLPDLASRLRAVVTAELGTPDDELLRAVLEKLFQDRQLLAPEQALSYLATHMDRSIEAARQAVAAIDKAALAGKRRITVPLVAEVLKQAAPSS
ncbi:MAG: chromosomal replication initiator DnaA [Rhodobiaceae bacterium]|nr:chromosomal replication initiator DnaA [Rhodobiaceae bacterium]